MSFQIQSEQINEFVAALSKAQGELSNAAKDKDNSFHKSKYADLSSVMNACREPLSNNNLAVIQVMQEIDDEQYLVTTLAHASGQFMRSYLPIKFKVTEKSNEMQQLGGCLTYLRRYALSAIVGIVTDTDHDGNDVTNYDATSKKARKSPTTQQPEPIPAMPLPPAALVAKTPETVNLLNNWIAQLPDEFKTRIQLVKDQYKLTDVNQFPPELFDNVFNAARKELAKRNPM